MKDGHVPGHLPLPCSIHSNHFTNKTELLEILKVKDSDLAKSPSFFLPKQIQQTKDLKSKTLLHVGSVRHV